MDARWLCKAWSERGFGEKQAQIDTNVPRLPESRHACANAKKTAATRRGRRGNCRSNRKPGGGYAFLWHSVHLVGAFFPFALSATWQSMQVPFFANGSWNAAWVFVFIGAVAGLVWQSEHFW